jgi:ribose-phosphate pyrophosphokinase
VEKFQKAYEEGYFTSVISTNLTYVKDEVKEMEWYVEADISKYIAYIISACNQNKSLSNLLGSSDRIEELLKKMKQEE